MRRGGSAGLATALCALLVASCATPYDPPSIYDETFGNGRSHETPSQGFAGLNDIVAAGASPRVLWTHGICTPDHGEAGKLWWQQRTRDLVAAYDGAEVVGEAVSRTLPGGSVVIVQHLSVPVPSGGRRDLELRFLDWSTITGPLKLNRHDPESPPGNAYRYRRATLNNDLKQGLVKDCMSDVVIYLASKAGDKIRSDARQALCAFFDGTLDASTGCEGALTAHPSVLIAESIGSSILSDSLRSLQFDYANARASEAAAMAPGSADLSSAKSLAERATNNGSAVAGAMNGFTSFFMLANQLPLLGLADALQPQTPTTGQALGTFLRERSTGAPPLTIVAFLDPNDVLSFRLIPRSDKVRIVNFVVSNDDTYLGYAELPTQAHCNYLQNAYVLHAIVYGYAGGKPVKGAVGTPQMC